MTDEEYYQKQYQFHLKSTKPSKNEGETRIEIAHRRAASALKVRKVQKSIRAVQATGINEYESLAIQYSTLSALDSNPKSTNKLNLLIIQKMENILNRINQIEKDNSYGSLRSKQQPTF